MSADSRIQAITARIVERSKPYRETYLERLRLQVSKGVHRSVLSCGNLAHGFAVCSPADKDILAGDRVPNLGIITAYNDMLSAHQPYETFPAIIRDAAKEAGGIAQVAGAVPAMCDGVTQGQPGMELSLFSRDAIAMAAGIGLSHNMRVAGRSHGCHLALSRSHDHRPAADCSNPRIFDHSALRPWPVRPPRR